MSGQCTQLKRALRTVLEQNDLPTGTALEDRVTWRLHRWGILDQTQYRVGRYRLDYAWPSQMVALEADGPFHQMPEYAARDAKRDSWLRSQGWLVLRVNDVEGLALDEQLVRVSRVVRSEGFA